ncbi:family 43 glycosylhydrolase [uncultured Parabacteroides sp.]|uniref:family 43 glycosylhydrolase n=1 Tax=uncultured Parabacteroides sp. TaxID=512312 RepID=UPI003422398D
MNKGLFITLFSLLLTSGIFAQSNGKTARSIPSEKEMGAYLMVYFTDPTHSLFMAVSRDGYSFTAVNNGQPVIAGDTIAEQRGIRDPHIYRGPDGAFYLAMTDLHLFAKQKGYRTTEWERDGELYGWGNNRGLILMKSFDLINWTHTCVRIDKAFPDEFGDIGCAWAPETTYDPVKKKMMIYFTIRKEGKGKTKLYYAYTDNDFTRLTTEPAILFEYPNPEIQVLDADITHLPDGRFCMTYVAQEKTGGIKMAFSDKINKGYSYQPQWIDLEPGACEAPNVWKRIGEDKWVLMYDIFSIKPHNFGFVETTDFITFKDLGHFNEGVMKCTNFSSPKHGAVIQITTEEADRLERHWNGKTAVVSLDSIHLSDPCILADKKTNMYYMTGTGGRLWKSKDLAHWEGPFNAVQTDPGSWMGPKPEIWAAELHEHNGKYYYFATFTNNAIRIDSVKGHVIPRRASHVLVSDHPEGPYKPMKDPVYLPEKMPTLDGTFWVDNDGKPYMVYCHEWLQNQNGTIEKIELKPDLSGPAGKGRILFRASDSPWSREKIDGKVVPNRVTDGPWLFRTGTGRLGMIWTSWIFQDYTQGVAYSESGTLDGPWIQEKKPVTPPNFGHGMLFQTLDGKWLMSVHSHKDVNGKYIRIPHLFEVDLSGDKLIIGKSYRP